MSQLSSTMARIPETIIDEIQHRTDIVEMIGRYVPLKRAGRNFKANCPFHKEKTPSFNVNTDKQMFYCFGCGVGGNIFSFLMQHDHLTFPEAVRQLADQVGIQIPESEQAASSSKLRESFVSLMEQACRYYERTLAASETGKAARAYLQQRGVSESTWHTFRLGLAPTGWDHLLMAAKARGVAPAQLEAVGLIIKGKTSYYDRFRRRLMFPIMDLRGKTVGFGGRSLDAQEPKYLNSPETALYSKGQHLFGLTQARDAIVAAKTVVVVEGYFDCVVLSGTGILHVVSPLGTAFTSDQARLLKRYAERVILAFDADAAGEQATLRGIDLLVELGLRVHIARLPQGVDPDEYARDHGCERFEQFLRESAGVIDFLIDSALRRYPNKTTEDRALAAQFVLPTIAKVPDAILRSEYMRILADRFSLDEAAVAQELGKIRPRPGAIIEQQPVAHQTEMVMARGPERLLAALVLDDPTRGERLRGQLPLEEFTDPGLRRIVQMIDESTVTGHMLSPAQIISRLSEEGSASMVAGLVELAETVSTKDEAFEDCVRRLCASAWKRRLAGLREQIRGAQQAGHEAEIQRLLTEYQEYLAAVPTTAQSSK